MTKLGLVLCLLPLGYVLAAPPPGADQNSPLGSWFRSLHVPGRPELSCCNVADCRRAETRQSATGYEVWINGAWRPVPANVILHVENLAGEPIVCLSSAAYIRCFVPGPDI